MGVSVGPVYKNEVGPKTNGLQLQPTAFYKTALCTFFTISLLIIFLPSLARYNALKTIAYLVFLLSDLNSPTLNRVLVGLRVFTHLQ